MGIIVGILVQKRLVINFSKVKFYTNFTSCLSCLFCLQSTVDTLWCLACVSLFIIPHFYPWFFKNSDTRNVLNLVDNQSLYDASLIAVSHFLWQLAFGWLLYSTSVHFTAESSNFAIRTLSHPFFNPFSRISFALYLMHVPLTWFVIHQTRFPLTRDEFGNVICLVCRFCSF